MSKDFHKQWITHVIVQSENNPQPKAILLKYEDSVVVETSYAEDRPTASRLLGTLDIEGNGLMEVPLIQCKSFHTDEEATSIMLGMEADERLLSYAR